MIFMIWAGFPVKSLSIIDLHFIAKDNHQWLYDKTG
jgi:hypothetical protein